MAISQREKIMMEIERRLLLVPGVGFVTRNPESPPDQSNFPAVQIFELDDEVEEQTMRGGKPCLKRKLQVAIEMYISASSQGARNAELNEFLSLVRRELYRTKQNFGGFASSWKEISMSRILVPPVGDNSIGVGVAIEILYLEDISMT